MQMLSLVEFYAAYHYFVTSTMPNISLLGLAVVEVAHDFVPKIKNWLLQQNIQNSFDTWHGK